MECRSKLIILSIAGFGIEEGKEKKKPLSTIIATIGQNNKDEEEERKVSAEELLMELIELKEEGKLIWWEAVHLFGKLRHLLYLIDKIIVIGLNLVRSMKQSHNLSFIWWESGKRFDFKRELIIRF